MFRIKEHGLDRVDLTSDRGLTGVDSDRSKGWDMFLALNSILRTYFDHNDHNKHKFATLSEIFERNE